MPQHGLGDGADIVKRYARPPVEERPRLGPQQQRLTGPRTCAPGEPAADLGRARGIAGARRPGEADGVRGDRISDEDIADDVLDAEDVALGHHRLELHVLPRGCRGGDADLIGERRVIDADFEHEAVELRLGEWVGPLALDRVLRAEDKKRIGQGKRLSRHGHMVLLHRLKERRLRLRRRAVDLVGEDEVGKHRPLDKPQLALPRGFVFLEDLGAGDVGGHEIGGELDPVERHREELGEARDHERLRQPRHPLENAVPLAEQGGEEEIEDVLLADDHGAQGPGHPPVGIGDHLGLSGHDGGFSGDACCSGRHREIPRRLPDSVPEACEGSFLPPPRSLRLP